MMYLSYTIMAILMLGILMPVCTWRIKGKCKTSFAKMRLRFYLIVIMLCTIIMTILFSITEYSVLMLAYFMVPVAIVAAIWNYIVHKEKYIQIMYIICVFMLMVGIITRIPWFISSKIQDDMKSEHTLSTQLLSLPSSVSSDVYRKSSVFMSEERVYFDIGSDHSRSYTIWVVKDTFLTSYLKEAVLSAYENKTTMRKDGQFTIYESNDFRVVQKGNYFIELDRAFFEQLDRSTYATLFDQIDKSYGG